MRLNNEQVESLNSIVEISLNRIYSEDNYLISMRGMERSIVFRFGLYISEQLKSNEFFRDFNVDLEYNKNLDNTKVLPRRPYGVQPDLIVHERGSNSKNILVVEFKGWWNNEDRTNDKAKLQGFCNQSGEYKYGYGILIEFEKSDYNLEYFIGYNLEM